MNRCVSILMILMLVVPFSLVTGCSRTPCYKGYVPATEADALAFARELMDRHERGDDSWFYSGSDLRDPECVKASAAALYFCGLDIPEFLRDGTPLTLPELTDEQKEAEAARRKETLSKTSDITFKKVEPKDGTYCICFECLYDGEKNEQRLTFIKQKKTGRFVILGTGMRPLEPKGE